MATKMLMPLGKYRLVPLVCALNDAVEIQNYDRLAFVTVRLQVHKRDINVAVLTS